MRKSVGSEDFLPAGSGFLDFFFHFKKQQSQNIWGKKKLTNRASSIVINSSSVTESVYGR